AVREAEAGLRRVERVAGRVLLVLEDRQTEEARAEAPVRAHEGGDVSVAPGGANAGKVLDDRRGVELLDPRLVHERIVERADLAPLGVGHRARRATGLGGILDDGTNLVLRLVTQRIEHAEARLVRRDRRARVPGAVGIDVEAVAGPGLRIDARQVEA